MERHYIILYISFIFLSYSVYSFSIDNLYDLSTFELYKLDEVVSLFSNKNNICYSNMLKLLLSNNTFLEMPVNWSVLGVYFMKSGYDYHSIQCIYLIEYLVKDNTEEALNSFLLNLLT